tara:strand:- start:94 stop:390 length:297 start_codon:yes stop_codon:yes gene_type:complete
MNDTLSLVLFQLCYFLGGFVVSTKYYTHYTCAAIMAIFFTYLYAPFYLLGAAMLFDIVWNPSWFVKHQLPMHYEWLSKSTFCDVPIMIACLAVKSHVM